MENYRRENALKVPRRYASKTHSLTDFDIPMGVLGTDCTEAIKVARSHQQRSSSP